MKSALQKGAKEAAATVNRTRNVTVEWRDGKVEKINEATTRRLTLQLYVDGRYSQVSSSDLRPEALDDLHRRLDHHDPGPRRGPLPLPPRPRPLRGPGRGGPPARGPGLPDRHPRAAPRGHAADGGGRAGGEGRRGHPLRLHQLRRHADGELPRRLQRLRGSAGRHGVLRVCRGQREGRGRPTARGLRLRRRSLPGRGPGGRGRGPRGGRAGDLPPRGEEAALGGDDAGRRQPRRGAADGGARGPADGRRAAAEALVPRGPPGPDHRQPVARRRRRPARPEEPSAPGSTTPRASPRGSGRSSTRASCAATTSTPTTGRS